MLSEFGGGTAGFDLAYEVAYTVDELGFGVSAEDYTAPTIPLL
jgi:hypothetical protein